MTDPPAAPRPADWVQPRRVERGSDEWRPLSKNEYSASVNE